MAGLKIDTAPTVEPVTVAEAKEHLRIESDETGFDSKLEALLVAVRQRLENEYGLAIMPQTWNQALDEFPATSDLSIVIARPPLQTLNSIAYTDSDGVVQTWSSDEYLINDFSDPAEINLHPDYSWPVTQAIKNAVILNYDAGWATADSVPQSIKESILFIVSNAFNYPETIITGTIIAKIPDDVAQWMEQFKRNYFA